MLTPALPPLLETSAGLAPLADLRGLTERMLAAADATDWAEVAALDAARAELLHAMAPGYLAAHAESVRAVLHYALDLTKLIAARAEQFRGAQAGTVKALQHAQRATGRYLDSAGATRR